MKLVLISLFAAFTSSAFATVSMSIQPNSPIIISADADFGHGDVVRGPWFYFHPVLTTDENAVIQALHVTVKSQEGQSISVDLPYDLTLNANTTTTGHDVHLGSLPASATDVYDVEIKLVGWTGLKNNPVGRLEVISNIQTQ